MKHFFSTLLVVFFATSMMAQTGLTCEDPIPVDKSYVGRVEADSELWYTASTWDLPLHVYFSPDVDDSQWSPEVQIDFTCQYGDYSHDHKLDSVLNILKVLGITMPVEFMCDKVVRNGKVEWDLSIDERYRDQLTEYGLTHNIQAFVKVYFPDGGEIRLTPDMTFQNCMENGHYVQLGETIQIAANDAEKMLVLPYSEWQHDSIRFVWTGDKPARVWVAEEECQFTPVGTSVYVKDTFDLDQQTIKKLYPADMKDAIKNWAGKGVFFGKVISEGEGQLIVERIPLGAIQGDAILLKHGESVQLLANDNRVFCFPKGWQATEFLANTQYLMAMHVSNTPEFEPGDANVISKYAFRKENNQRELQLTKTDIASLATSATDDYLYVRFVCNRATSLTPSAWSVEACLNRTVLIQSGETFLYKSSNNYEYRMRYADWVDYDFTASWNQSSGLSSYLSSYCDFTTTDPNRLDVVSVGPKSTETVKKEKVNSWASSIDDDGYIYVIFSSSRNGRITFTSAKPAETDPEGPVLDPVYTTESATICYGESYEWNGKEYNATGKYTYTTVAANGADSIVTLDLTVYPQTEATTENVEVAYGETYTWNGTTYTESGEYTITLQDENGCDYQATLVLTVLPEQKPENPCVAVSTLLEPVAQLTLNLGDAFDIYRIDYQAWLASGVNLVWTGKGALHTFVAKDCEFAVAVHHQDVVNYTEVPAEGSVVLSKTILAGLAQYVDADGYLYVRFLTEFEGQLTTAKAE